MDGNQGFVSIKKNEKGVIKQFIFNFKSVLSRSNKVKVGMSSIECLKNNGGSFVLLPWIWREKEGSEA